MQTHKIIIFLPFHFDQNKLTQQNSIKLKPITWWMRVFNVAVILTSWRSCKYDKATYWKNIHVFSQYS